MIALLMYGVLHAQVLSLDEVLVSVHPVLQAADQAIYAAEGDAQSARGGFDTSLKSELQSGLVGYYKYRVFDVELSQPTRYWGARFEVGYRSSEGVFPVYNSQDLTFTLGRARLQAAVPLLQGGSIDERRAGLMRTEIAVSASRVHREMDVRDIKRGASKRYWEWVIAGQKTAVARDLLNIALSRDKALLTRVKHGDVAQIDYTDNQRAVVQRRSNVITAERSLQQAALALSLYLRDEHGVPRVVTSDLLPDTMPRCEGELRTDQAVYPDIDAMGKKIDALGVDLHLAENIYLPTMDFKMGLTRDFGINPGIVDEQLPPTGAPLEVKAELVFQMPLFRRTARGQIASLTAERERVSLEKELLQQKLTMHVANLRQSMGVAQLRSEFALQEVAFAKKLEQAEKTRFVHGDGSFFMINMREQATQDALYRQIEAQGDYCMAHVELMTYRELL